MIDNLEFILYSSLFGLLSYAIGRLILYLVDRNMPRTQVTYFNWSFVIILVFNTLLILLLLGQ